MSVVSYKCPNCGADLKFDPKSQLLSCDYCTSSFTESELEALVSDENYTSSGEEHIDDIGESSNTSVEEVNVYTCPNCGAEIITDTVTSATICCYCHNPVVLSRQLSDEFRPSKLIPFQKSKEDALQTFKDWCGKKHFLPPDFSSPSQLEKIAGIYVPFWLVDCDTSGYLRATGKNTTHWSDSNYRYTKTDIYSVSRSATMSFNYIPHDASKKAEDKVMDSLSPFDYTQVVDFSYSYLSGFIAEKYDVTKEEVYPDIKALAHNAVLNELKSSITGYSTTSIGSSNVQIHDSKFHYSLLPIWMLTYIYEGKTYMYAMNGQTGKTFGSLPICKHKVNKFTLGLFIVIFLVVFIALSATGGFSK